MTPDQIELLEGYIGAAIETLWEIQTKQKQGTLPTEDDLGDLQAYLTVIQNKLASFLRRDTDGKTQTS